MKQCYKCREIKPVIEFSKSAGRHDKLQPECKACAKSYRDANSEKRAAYQVVYRSDNPEKKAAYRAKNKAKIAAYSKAYNGCYHAANRDKINARHAASRAAYPEKARAVAAKWKAANPKKIAAYYATNKEKIAARHAAWDKSNPEARRMIGRIGAHTRRARKRENGGKLSPSLSNKLFILQRGKCACCGRSLGKNYHLDHIVPLFLGGANEDWNIQLLRAKCNLEKHAKHPIEFMQSRGYLL